MSDKLYEVAERIRGLRDIMDFSVAEMAAATGTTQEEYEKLESGEYDFSFTFLYQCAQKLEVDMADILTGESPRLSFYTLVRAGKGLPIKRREGFSYNHLAHMIKNKTAEPFLVTAPYKPEEQNAPIKLSYHKGQEFDYILQGSLKVAMEDHIEILHAGDSIYYDSGHGHGMVACDPDGCVFLAVVMHDSNTEDR